MSRGEETDAQRARATGVPAYERSGGHRLTHYLQYEQPDGSFRAGHLAYTRSEAIGVAREGRKRTGRKVRIRKLLDA